MTPSLLLLRWVLPLLAMLGRHGALAQNWSEYWNDMAFPTPLNTTAAPTFEEILHPRDSSASGSTDDAVADQAQAQDDGEAETPTLGADGQPFTLGPTLRSIKDTIGDAYKIMSSDEMRNVTKVARKMNKVIVYEFIINHRERVTTRRWLRALKTFALEDITKKIEAVADGISNLFLNTWGRYFRDRMFWARVKSMSPEEFAAEFNRSLPQPEQTPVFDPMANRSREFSCDGKIMSFSAHGTHFQPYDNYSCEYYSLDIDDVLWTPPVVGDPITQLPGVTFPAPSYPWPWRDRLAMVRTTLCAILSDAQEAATTVDVCSDGSTRTSSNQRRLFRWSAGSRPAAVMATNTTKQAEQVLQNLTADSVDQLQQLIDEFHFSTGLPNYPNVTNRTRAVFITKAEFFKRTVHGNASSPLAPFIHRDAGSDAARERVFTALTHVYAFPSVDHILVGAAVNGCSIATACLKQSSVTVFAPALLQLDLVADIKQLSSVDFKAQRLAWITRVIEDAFQTETTVLRYGLQAPSTSWYSAYDRTSDELADAIIGYCTLAARSEPPEKPVKIYLGLTASEASPLHAIASYTGLLNREHTTLRDRKQLSLELLSKSEQQTLLSLLLRRIEALEADVAEYIARRDSDSRHIALVKKAKLHLLVNDTSDITSARIDATTIAFGFKQYGRNEKNVVFRNFRRPVPMHLVVRVIARLQECRLLAPDEVVHMLACLGMRLRGIDYFKCHDDQRSASSASTSAEPNAASN